MLSSLFYFMFLLTMFTWGFFVRQWKGDRHHTKVLWNSIFILHLLLCQAMNQWGHMWHVHGIVGLRCDEGWSILAIIPNDVGTRNVSTGEGGTDPLESCMCVYQ